MFLKKQKPFLFSLLFGLLLIAIPLHFSSARGLVPCGGTGERACNVEDAFTLVAIVTNWLIGMAGLYAVYKIIDHGFWLVLSMGNEENITTHKSGLTDAVVGFVLVMIAFMIINTVVNYIFIGQVAKGIKDHGNCQLNLKSPLTYLTTNPNPCSGIPDSFMH